MELLQAIGLVILLVGPVDSGPTYHTVASCPAGQTCPVDVRAPVKAGSNRN